MAFLQVEMGLRLPACQIVPGREVYEGGMFQDAGKRAMVGTNWYGSSFFSETHMELPSSLAARFLGTPMD